MWLQWNSLFISLPNTLPSDYFPVLLSVFPNPFVQISQTHIVLSHPLICFIPSFAILDSQFHQSLIYPCALIFSCSPLPLQISLSFFLLHCISPCFFLFSLWWEIDFWCFISFWMSCFHKLEKGHNGFLINPCLEGASFPLLSFCN